LKHKVLILGSTGLIGHQVYNYLELNSDYLLSNISFRKKLNKLTILQDALDIEGLVNQINIINPTVIVNCIGTLISQSNKDPVRAIFLNSYLPHKLKRIANQIDAKLIHMSTDCVFSGDKKEPYNEMDFKDGRDIYAKTKDLGEIVSKKHLTLRTSVVGPELKVDGGELFNWFMSQKHSVKGFSNAIWSGITSIELAKAVMWSIDNNIKGLYHLTNNKSISKYELLKLFKKYTQKKIEIISVDTNATNKSFIDTRGLINYEIPSYEVMISDLTKSISKNKSLYPHYDTIKYFG
tara:strand:+ start:123 stop:1001 length:879 start_codon:yes stop_codon:yes gene_type:complete